MTADQSVPRRSKQSGISIVIAAHNAAAYLADQLDGLAQQACEVPWEVVVVDNKSTDETAQIAASFADRMTLRIVDATDGMGPGYARNLGVRETTAPWVIFCDADDVIAEGWLAAFATAFERHEFIAGPTDLDRLNDPWAVESRGRGFASKATSFFGVFPYASTCNVGIHRLTFDRVGGFDEDFMRGEDVELSLRLWQMGVELYFEPAAVVHYRLRSSLREIFHQSRQYGAVHPVILERLRQSGLLGPSRFSGARRWGWLLKNCPLLRTRSGRARWLWVAGTQVGRLQGGLSVGRLYL